MAFKPCRVFLLAALALLMLAGGWPSGPKTFVLYHFTGGKNEWNPQGPLIFDGAGNLYGASQGGLIFELSPPAIGGGQWSKTVLYPGNNGSGPHAGLIFDQSGNLYGSNFEGGNCGFCGLVFRLSPPVTNGGSWTYSVLHAFTGPQGDGGGVNGNLVLDSRGNLYGTTVLGGTADCPSFPGPCGTVFELSPPAAPDGAWKHTILHSFRGVPDGQFPSGGVIFDSSGNLYGTTHKGGTGECTDGESQIVGCGTVYKLSPSPHGWTESILDNFNKRGDDVEPEWNLAWGLDGGLYGTVGYQVYRLLPPHAGGHAWTHETLHQFKVGIGGTIPSSGVFIDANGVLYGTTMSSGLVGYGTAFKLAPPLAQGGRWTLTSLASFGNPNHGTRQNEEPFGGLVIGKYGWLYGAALNFTQQNLGYVFAITQ